jgi:hypothetical protein
MIASSRSRVESELRQILRTPVLWRSCATLIAIGVLATVVNAKGLAANDTPRQTANAFTSMNTGVFLAMLLGVLGTTGDCRLPVSVGLDYRRALGAKARAYGLIGVASVLLLGGAAAAIALPIIHARGVPSPSSHVVVDYFQRETIAGARLALIGVAIGVLAVNRRRAVIALICFLVVEAVAEAQVPFIRNYGPLGALNAFSDPSHRHQLSTGTGAAIALGWALLSLAGAALISERWHTEEPAPQPAA